MAHPEQQQYCTKIRDRFPEYFKEKKVLDVGSQDINGNNRYLFENCLILGIDLGPGRNVDFVCHGADLEHPDESYDFIISTEAFEHDSRFEESLKNITRMLKSGGMFLFTCASTGRPEHGTSESHPGNSPHTLDFYQNRTEEEVKGLLDLDDIFQSYEFENNTVSCDLSFWGIKK